MKSKLLQSSLVIAGLLFIGTVLFAQDIESGLVVYYPMNGDGVSGLDNGPEAFLEGDVIASEGFNGTANGALYFDGDLDRMQVGDSLIEGLPIEDEARSMACWAYIESDAGNLKFINYGLPSSDPKGGHCHFAYRPDEEGGRIRVGHWYADYDWDGIDLKDDAWHHVAFTFDGSAFILYLNGEEVSLQEINPDLEPIFTVLNGVFAIGARNVPELNDAIMGSLDEVRVYNRVLSEDDILALYEFDPDKEPSAVSFLNSNSFKVYPNPANDLVSITDIQAGVNYGIVNIIGQEVISGIADQTIVNLNVSGLVAGVYFVNVNGISEKIIIK